MGLPTQCPELPYVDFFHFFPNTSIIDGYNEHKLNTNWMEHKLKFFSINIQDKGSLKWGFQHTVRYYPAWTFSIPSPNTSAIEGYDENVLLENKLDRYILLLMYVTKFKKYI